jgi:hypothetical protein
VGVCVEFHERAKEGDNLRGVSKSEMEKVWTEW